MSNSIFKFSRYAADLKQISFFTSAGAAGTVLVINCADYVSAENLRFNAHKMILAEDFIGLDDIENIIVAHGVKLAGDSQEFAQ